MFMISITKHEQYNFGLAKKEDCETSQTKGIGTLFSWLQKMKQHTREKLMFTHSTSFSFTSQMKNIHHLTYEK